jgi:hypothetical protein
MIKHSTKFASEYMIGHGEILQRPEGGSEDEWITVDLDRAFCHDEVPVGEYTELEIFEREMVDLFGKDLLVKNIIHFQGVIW